MVRSGLSKVTKCQDDVNILKSFFDMFPYLQILLQNWEA